jgi:hypothetical protein
MLDTIDEDVLSVIEADLTPIKKEDNKVMGEALVPVTPDRSVTFDKRMLEKSREMDAKK